MPFQTCDVREGRSRVRAAPALARWPEPTVPELGRLAVATPTESPARRPVPAIWHAGPGAEVMLGPRQRKEVAAGQRTHCKTTASYVESRVGANSALGLFSPGWNEL